MSISDRLDEIQARADEAADLIGALAAGTSSWRMRVPVDDEDSDVTLMRAVEGCEKAVAALRAVLDLHKRVSELWVMDYCAECVEFDDDLDPEMSDAATRVVWPCPTYRAVTAALGEES